MGIFTKQVNPTDSSDKTSKKSRKIKLIIVSIIVVALLAAFLDYPKAWNKSAEWVNTTTGIELLPNKFFDVPFKLGLDLQGGTHLIYEADLSSIDKNQRSEAMQGVRDVIERRINMFGVSEPVVQVNKSDSNYRLIVELAGIKDVHRAIEMIGETPSLIFKQPKDQAKAQKIQKQQQEIKKKIEEGKSLEDLTQEEKSIVQTDPRFSPTELTGRYLENARVQFDRTTGKPYVSLQFDDDGAEIFEKLTQKYQGKQIAIYLDGSPISAPVVQEPITGGKAQISGNFSLQEAKKLVQRLNAGALPVPINLINQQTIGASLGENSLNQSLEAAIWGFILLLIFIVIFYRLPGLITNFSLIVYVVLLLAIFKLIPVTLTLAGIAGFILSMGMAVDANILIFERFKEEINLGKSLGRSVEDAFDRAWPAIRDGSISTIITCIILYIFTTSLIKGFALTLGIGVLMSMFMAMIITKNFMRGITNEKLSNIKKLWS